MPPAETILSGLFAIAHDWRTLAIGWHVFVGAILITLAARPRLSNRLLGGLLVLPLISVSGLAWISGNPFNGVFFAALSLGLAGIARGLDAGEIRFASRFAVLSGALLITFGWVYPHFLQDTHWAAYLIAAPLGLLPCPTLAVVIGITLIAGTLRSRAWSTSVGAAGVFYGAFGIAYLGVTIDVALLAGALVLLAIVMRPSIRQRSVGADPLERTRTLPGDELIPKPFETLTHAVTIERPPSAVWPWLAQMGAGARAGWYSYDFLDNGRCRSATRIVPELQHLTPGMIFPAAPGVIDGFTLLAFERERFLVLSWLSPDGRPRATWTFVLNYAPGAATRLIVRVRGGQGYEFFHLPPWLSKRVVPLIHFVMQRKQLLEIARRVEGAPMPPDMADRAA